MKVERFSYSVLTNLSEKSKFENDETQQGRRYVPPPPHHHLFHIFEITLLSVPKINKPQEHFFNLFQAQAEIKTPAEHETLRYLFLTNINL